MIRFQTGFISTAFGDERVWRTKPIFTALMDCAGRTSRRSRTNWQALVCVAFVGCVLSQLMHSLSRKLLLHMSSGLISRTTWISLYKKGKTSPDLNETRDDGVWGCIGISWTMCIQSAPRSRQITTPAVQHFSTQFLQARCTSWHPTISVKALKTIYCPEKIC